MNMHQLNPYIRVAWDSTLHPPVFIRRRALFDYEILYVMTGNIRVVVEETVYYGKYGDLFLFKPKQHHSIEVLGDTPVRQPHLHFDLVYQSDSPDIPTSFLPIEAMTEQEKRQFREDVTAQMADPLPNHFRLQQPIVLEKLIFDIIHEYANRHPLFELTAKGIFLQLLAQLMREHLWATHASLVANWVQLQRVKVYLSHHPDREVTLEELSDVANLSKYYLSRLFKKAFGMGPIRFHLLNRIERAKRLIQFTDAPITQISEQLGFPGIHSFSRSFRSATGVPPSFYRNRKSERP